MTKNLVRLASATKLFGV